MISPKYSSLAVLVSLLSFSSSEAMENKPFQTLTPQKCKEILLNPASSRDICDVCLRKVLRVSSTRAEFIKAVHDEKSELPSQAKESLHSEKDASHDTLAEENPISASHVTPPESVETSGKDTALPVEPTSTTTPLVKEEASIALPSENKDKEAPLSQNTEAPEPIDSSTASLTLKTDLSLPSSATESQIALEPSSVSAPTLSPAIESKLSSVVSSPSMTLSTSPSQQAISPAPLSARDAQKLQDHLPDPVLQRTRAIQASENSIDALAGNIRGDQEKITSLRESIEKNKAILEGHLPLPPGATLKGLQSRIEVDTKKVETQENHIQSQTKEIQTLKEKSDKLQGEIHAILDGDKAKGLLASRYATKLENQKGEIVRKQAVHDLSVLTLSEAQQAYAASTGVSFGFEIPIEQQMKNQRLAEHLDYLAERLREDDPDNEDLAAQLELQAKQLREVTSSTPHKKIPEIRHQKIMPQKVQKSKPALPSNLKMKSKNPPKGTLLYKP